jgi:Phage integrase family.
MASIQKRGKTYSVIFYNGEGESRTQMWESGFSFAQAKTRKATIELEESQGIKEHTQSQTIEQPQSQTIEQPQILPKENVTSRAVNVAENKYTNSFLLLKSFMVEFIEVYGRKKWGSSYYNSSLNLLNNYVYGYWEGIHITDFTVKGIDEYYSWLVNECPTVINKYNRKKKPTCVTPSVVNDIHKILRCAFNQAKKWQYISNNPFLDATLPEYKSKERPALTPSEIEAVLKYTDKPEDYDLYLIHCAMNLAFAGSMRGGEIGALQWEDIIDEQRRILYIHKAIDRVNKTSLEKVSKTKVFLKFPTHTLRGKSIVVLKNTKEDGGSDRNCYLPELVYEKLIRFKAMQEDIKSELGSDGYLNYNLIICQENGSPIMTEHLNRKFQSVLNEMNIKPKHGDKQYVFHSIRATATTYKLRVSGGDIKAVQGDNGQKDPKMVTHQYSRILDEDRIKIAETMNNDFYRKEEHKNREDEIFATIQKNPELFNQFMAFMSVANIANNKS